MHAAGPDGAKGLRWRVVPCAQLQQRPDAHKHSLNPEKFRSHLVCPCRGQSLETAGRNCHWPLGWRAARYDTIAWEFSRRAIPHRWLSDSEEFRFKIRNLEATEALNARNDQLASYPCELWIHSRDSRAGYKRKRDSSISSVFNHGRT